MQLHHLLSRSSRPQLTSARLLIVRDRNVNARASGNMIFAPGVRKPVSLPRHSPGDMMQPYGAEVGTRMLMQVPGERLADKHEEDAAFERRCHAGNI